MININNYPKSKILLQNSLKGILQAMQGGMMSKLKETAGANIDAQVPDISDELVAKYMDMILNTEANQRSLFDFFDGNRIFITITKIPGDGFMYNIYNSNESTMIASITNSGDSPKNFSSRLLAEKDAFINAFDILEAKLQ